MERESERAVVARLKSGDPRAFDQVYECYRARLFGFLARMARRLDLAEDLLQETWMRLAKHAHRLDDDTRLGPWLFTVARNLYRSHRRWTLLDRERIEELGQTRAPAAETSSPFDLLSASELERKLELGLASLPEKYREVLLLVAVEQMTPTEAAAVVKVKPEALRQRLARARGMLAARLEEKSRGARAAREVA